MVEDNSTGRITGIGYAIVSILLVSIAQLLIKAAALNIDFSAASHQLSQYIELAWYPAFIFPFLLAGALYTLSFFFWIRTLSHLPLNLAYPLLSLSYPIVYIAAVSIGPLGESFSILRAAGVALIVMGVVLVSLGKD